MQCIDDDPVSSFISSWIAFNHIYSAHAAHHNSGFKDWAKSQGKARNRNPLRGDKAELEFFALSSELKSILDEIKGDFEEKLPQIELPVKSVIYDKDVPSNISREINIFELSSIELFFTVYQIRNNLFRGSKDPKKFKRDAKLCVIASQVISKLNEKMLTRYFTEL